MHEQMKRLYKAAIELRSIKGQSALARELNESPQTVKNWESRGISKKGILKAQTTIGCAANWLENGVGSMQSTPHPDIQRENKTANLLSNNVSSIDINRNIIPILSELHAHDFVRFANNLVPSLESHDMEMFETSVEVKAHTFAMRVSGDSMEPDFIEGSVIVIEPDMTPEANDFVVAQISENEITFKQLVKDGGDWYLKPLNNRYPLKPIGTAKIIGVVREVVRKLR